MENFNEWQIGLLMLVLGYTLVMGAKNTVYRVMSWFGASISQSERGKMMDTVYYACIGYLCYVYINTGGVVSWLN